MQDCTVLLDECSELPKDVTMMLLTVLNPNAENRTTFSYEDYTVDFDFSRQSFMFATTEAQSVFHALMDRCERVDLEEYTYNELAEIVCRVLPEYSFQDDVLMDVSRYCAAMLVRLRRWRTISRASSCTRSAPTSPKLIGMS